MSAAAPTFISIPVGDIQPNPRQPRQVFDEAALNELAGSIKEHGIIQPLIVEPNTDPATASIPYTLIAGERRLRAAAIAGLDLVPCIVRAPQIDQNRLELALIENVQRADLSVADEARAYQQLHDEFGLTDEAIGQRVGKARATVTTTRNLAKLPESVINRIGEGEGQLPKRTVRQLLPLAKAVSAAELIKITDEIVSLEPDDIKDADDIISASLNDNAYRLPAKGDGWDLAWPGKPIKLLPSEVVDDLSEIPACAGCPNHVVSRALYFNGGSHYCVSGACLEVKTRLFAEKELGRVYNKFGIPLAGPDETVNTLGLNYVTTTTAKKWLEKPPEHLRLIDRAKADGKKVDWQHKQLLGSPVVALGSLLKDPFKSQAEATRDTASDRPETEAQRQKRIKAEAEQQQLRRAERGALRKARADVAWLGVQTAQRVAPQIIAVGPTLDFLAWFVDDRARSDGEWPAMAAALWANEKALEAAKGKAREPLLRERIVLKVLYEQVPSYSNYWETEWEQVVASIEEAITTRAGPKEDCALGLKLPAGWNQPPIHKTESNCWHCGAFTPNATITQVDREDGWGTASEGSGNAGVVLKDVYCPACGKAIRAKVRAEIDKAYAPKPDPVTGRIPSIKKSKPAPKPAKAKK
jgi:ParB/RepB/Spo0J family partition protein